MRFLLPVEVDEVTEPQGEVAQAPLEAKTGSVAMGGVEVKSTAGDREEESIVPDMFGRLILIGVDLRDCCVWFEEIEATFAVMEAS